MEGWVLAPPNEGRSLPFTSSSASFHRAYEASSLLLAMVSHKNRRPTTYSQTLANLHPEVSSILAPSYVIYFLPSFGHCLPELCIEFEMIGFNGSRLEF